MKETTLPLRETVCAEALLRSALGLLFLLQGISKFLQISEVGYAAFVSGMSGGFANTFLPVQLTNIFFYLLPVLEVLFGALLLSGYRRVWSLVGTGILIIALLFGHVVGKMPFDSLFILLLTVAGALVLPTRSFWGKVSSANSV